MLDRYNKVAADSVFFSEAWARTLMLYRYRAMYIADIQLRHQKEVHLITCATVAIIGTHTHSIVYYADSLIPLGLYVQ